MTKRYVLGVDGGNTKTDYLLFDTEGQFVDHIRAGTCSHEAIPDSYSGTKRIMGEVTEQLLTRNGLRREDLAASVFGLAGVDLPKQQAALEAVVSELGFQNTKVMNDSFLGIKGGSLKGAGVCSINGTGTVAGGIDPQGNWLQVGGMGFVFGDEAGGNHLAQRAVRTVYDSLYRCGEPTAMAQPMMKLFGVSDPELFAEAVTDNYLMRRNVTSLDIIHIVMAAADQEDAGALGVLRYIGEQLARSAAGCVRGLQFGDEVDVILAGSVWVKSSNKAMQREFELQMERLTGKRCNIILLDVPPATGAVLWAIELANGEVPGMDIRSRVWESVTANT